MPGAKATRGARTSSPLRKADAKFSVMDAHWKPAKNTMLTQDPDTLKLLLWLPLAHTCPNGEMSLTWLRSAAKPKREPHVIC